VTLCDIKKPADSFSVLFGESDDQIVAKYRVFFNFLLLGLIRYHLILTSSIFFMTVVRQFHDRLWPSFAPDSGYYHLYIYIYVFVRVRKRERERERFDV
jgi:hypothetical protein